MEIDPIRVAVLKQYQSFSIKQPNIQNFTSFLNDIFKDISYNKTVNAHEAHHIFQLIDRNSDGIITQHEVCQRLPKLLGNAPSQLELKLSIHKQSNLQNSTQNYSTTTNPSSNNSSLQNSSLNYSIVTDLGSSITRSNVNQRINEI